MRIKHFLLLTLLFSPPVFAIPEIQHWTLDNGVGVYFVPSHELPMVDIRILLDAGANHDPAHLQGLAALTISLLDEGTDTYSANEIAEQFDARGAELSTDVDHDFVSISFRSLSKHTILNENIALLKSLLTDATFPKDSLELMRRQRLQSLKQEEQSPARIAHQNFMQTLYQNHPYGNRAAGNEAGVRAITRADILQFHQHRYVANQAVIALVGDISRKQADEIARTLAGHLNTKETVLPVPPPKAPAKSITKRIQYPSTQSHIVIGQLGIKRNDPDYFTLYVGNSILGGSGLTARLTQKIPEEHGLAYSTYSYFYPQKYEGPFVVNLQTKNESRQQAIELLKAELKNYINNGPTAEELARVKKFITGSFPLRIDSNRDIVEYLAVIGFYQLPLTYLNDFNKSIEAVTLEQINDAFSRRIDPEKMVTVIVGNLEQAGKREQKR